MRMNNGVYNALKNVAQIYLPAAGTLYVALAAVWGLPASEEVVSTVVAVDTFLGVILGISSASYNATGKYDGNAVVTSTPEGKTQVSLELNQDAGRLLDKTDLSFKIVK